MSRPRSLHSTLVPTEAEREAQEKVRARRLTACQVVRSAAPGLVERCSARRDEGRRVLTVEVRWQEHATDHDRRVGLLKAESSLQFWVWDGWTVEVTSVE